MISDELEKTLQRAKECASNLKHEYMTIEHLLYSLIEDEDASEVFKSCDINVNLLKNELENFLNDNLNELVNNSSEEVKPTLGFQRVIQRAVIHVQSSGKDEASAKNVLVSIFSERESHAVYFLQKQNLTRLDVIDYISHGIKKNDEPVFANNSENESDEKVDTKDFISQYCVNLNEKAENNKIDPIIGRSKEILRTIHVLSRRNKNNPIFVGDPGVGKTALAEGLALKIVKKEVPLPLQNMKIFSLDLGGLVAGTRFRGDFEERLKKLINFFESHDDSILFIDEIHTIIGAGGTSSGSIDASNILKPALTRGNLKCIGSTTYSEYRNYFEKDRALCRRFQKIDINEPSLDDSIKILEGLKKFYEKFHSVTFEDECATEAVKLSKKYLLNTKLPDKAIDLLDETAASVKIDEKRKVKNIKTSDIQETLSKIANIPPNSIKSDEKIKLKNLERDLKTLIFGQDKAISALSSAMKLSKTGLRNKDKTIGSFLFTGPTGVGKTELSKQLANVMKINFVRFDMSEYMERHSVSKLIGAPPGYVGYDQGGLLTDSIDKNPFSVILLDEIEKAHPDVFNILLQVMDYGRLTDHMGKSIDFTNVILIMTSNIGANEIIKEKIGFLGDFSNNDNEKAISSFFSPEFRNRIDAIINFQMLGRKESMKIVDKLLMELETLLVDKDLTLNVSEKVKKKVQDLGFDKNNGARPMAKVIQEKIKVPLSEIILKSKQSSGTVFIDLNRDNSFKITIKKNEKNNISINP
ncbi:MAG: ATP-dependent Clp protease ATP-binding subunit ClpA [Alphaproteobacteria bacterium]